MGADEINKSLEQSKISPEREYIELCATIRHYSNLRFLIMPIYFTINGAMFLGFRDLTIRDIPNLWAVIALLSTLMASVFCIVEYKLNRYIDRYIDHAGKFVPASHWLTRKGGNIILISFLSLYAAFAGSWWFFAWHASRGIHS